MWPQLHLNNQILKPIPTRGVGGRFCPTIAEVAPKKFSLWSHLWIQYWVWYIFLWISLEFEFAATISKKSVQIISFDSKFQSLSINLIFLMQNFTGKIGKTLLLLNALTISTSQELFFNRAKRPRMPDSVQIFLSFVLLLRQGFTVF